MVTSLFGQPEAGVESKAAPCLNARVNQVGDPAIRPRSANRNECFDRPPSRSKFHGSALVKRAEL